MSDGFSHSGRMYRTLEGGFGTTVFWRVLRVFVFVTSAIHWRALPLLSIQRKINFAAFCLIYYEFCRKIPEIFSFLCWHRNRRDRDPVIFNLCAAPFGTDFCSTS